MNKILKKIGLALFIVAAIFVVTEFSYLQKILSYFLAGPPAIETELDSVAQKPLVTPDILTIESLGITAPVIYVEEASEKVFQAALARGVVHYPGTALPGQAGNVYIFGHSSDLVWAKGDYKTVFALLPQIKIGSEIMLSNSAGQPFVYKVIESFAVNANDTQWLASNDYEKKLLTLQTSYPIGTALRRWIVRAELVESR